MEKKIGAIVFDMDGVILDTERICRRTWSLAGNDFNLSKEKSEEGFMATIGCNKNDTKIMVHQLFGENFPVESFIEKTSFYFNQISSSEGIPLMPKVVETLTYLKSKYRIALASSTRKQAVVPQLTAAKVIDFFETLTTGDSVVHSKPAPDIYINACKSLNLPCEECVAVEDSPNGIKSAFSAGLSCIMIPDQVKPDKEIKKLLWKQCESFAELKNVL